MTDQKYKCEDCSKELPTSVVRLLMMINASHELKVKNEKLLKFVKDLAWFSKSEEDLNHIIYTKTNQVSVYEANQSLDTREFLKEIGEL